MVILPAIFIAVPIVLIFTAPHSETSPQLANSIGAELLFMLVIPTMIPSTLASYSVVGEREQGTLEPVLTTPIRSEEFAIGKALAVLVPTLVISYVAFLVYLACALFAHPSVTSAVFGSSHLLILFLFTPLLASWSIWAGIAISTRSSDVRVAQSLGTFASFPPLVLTALIVFNVIPQTFGSIFGLVAALLFFTGFGWRLVRRSSIANTSSAGRGRDLSDLDPPWPDFGWDRWRPKKLQMHLCDDRVWHSQTLGTLGASETNHSVCRPLVYWRPLRPVVALPERCLVLGGKSRIAPQARSVPQVRAVCLQLPAKSIEHVHQHQWSRTETDLLRTPVSDINRPPQGLQ